MDLFPANSLVFEELNSKAEQLEEKLKTDVIQYIGPINPQYKGYFISEIEKISRQTQYKKLSFFITTYGGSAEMVEIMVEIMRNYYQEVYFFVPDYAYSAGTILCMSGDKIYMNYYSSLGPIDPQILVHGKYVSAQGYIDQFNAIVEKSKIGTMSPIEIQMALNLDLADINFYQQATFLTVSLLKKWLVQYKFKDWKRKDGSDVSNDEKEQRAEEIAKVLGDNSLWNSHSRHIGVKTLRETVKLKIEDMNSLPNLEEAANTYYRLAVNYSSQLQPSPIFIHSKKSRSGL